MYGIFFNIMFTLFTIYVFIKTTSYGIYEIKQENNKVGGITVICFSLFSIIVSNLMLWLILLVL